MKTKSIKSIATLLGVGVALNLSALAGPGPQPESLIRNGTDSKNVVALQVRKSSSTGKSVVEASPKLVQITGPHGTTLAYVR